MTSTIDTSGIDPTKPLAIIDTTQGSRDNFEAIKTQLGNAKTDIEALQSGKLATDGDGSAVTVTATGGTAPLASSIGALQAKTDGLDTDGMLNGGRLRNSFGSEDAYSYSTGGQALPWFKWDGTNKKFRFAGGFTAAEAGDPVDMGNLVFSTVGGIPASADLADWQDPDPSNTQDHILALYGMTMGTNGLFGSDALDPALGYQGLGRNQQINFFSYGTQNNANRGGLIELMTTKTGTVDLRSRMVICDNGAVLFFGDLADGDADPGINGVYSEANAATYRGLATQVVFGPTGGHYAAWREMGDPANDGFDWKADRSNLRMTLRGMQSGVATEIAHFYRGAGNILFEKKIGVGLSSGTPTQRVQINEDTVGDGAYIHLTNAATGSSASDGLLVGMDSTGAGIIHRQETGKPVSVYLEGTERCRWTSGGVNLVNGGDIYINSTKVVGPPKTGWTLPTGTGQRSGYTTYTAPTISASPTRAEVQAIAAGLQDVSRSLYALIADLHATAGHGLIGA